MARKRLAELGYTSPIGELSSWKANAFVTISAYIDELVAKEHKRQAAKHRSKR